MNIRTVIILSTFSLLNLSFISASYADAICNDGWRSKSSGSGTCSWHGGVLNWLPKSESSNSYSRDTYYDNSDNGSGGSSRNLCTYKDRRDGETIKECGARKLNDIRDMLLNYYRVQAKEYKPITDDLLIDFDKQTLEPYYNPFGQ